MFGIKKNTCYIIIAGCGTLGAELAGKLAEANEVTIIDNNINAFEKLPYCYNGFTFNGDVNNAGVLEEAGIQNANALIAVTGNDVLNIFLSLISKKIYHVERVYAGLTDPRFRDTYSKLEIKTLHSSGLWLEAFRREMSL